MESYMHRLRGIREDSDKTQQDISANYQMVQKQSSLERISLSLIGKWRY
jgi:hypothetical protein